MNIIFLDSETLGNDLDFGDLLNEGNVKIYPTCSQAEALERIKDAEVLITNKVILGKAEMDAAPNLKLICVAATGYNVIDIAEASKRGIPVANVKGYSTEAVVQLTFALLLSIENSISPFVADVNAGKWQQSPIFTLLTYPVFEISGKTLGIIGYGTIGKRVAEIAKAFGMKVLVANLQNKQYAGENRVSMDELLKNSDVISIHSPLSDLTRDLITAKELNLMKPTAVLINTARGGIVNENDLYAALVSKKIRAAAFDVLTAEPPVNGNKLIGAPNMLVTPHIAWTSVESRRRLLAGIVDNIKQFKAGNGDKIKVN